MKIAIGADHAGFPLKEQLRGALLAGGHDVLDEGTDSAAPCDYPDFAGAVAQAVRQGRAERGILVCSTGVGMAIAANKFAGIRAVQATSDDAVRLSRAHNDANVLTFGARYVDAAAARELIEAFLTTGFDGGERHRRRLGKIQQMERS